MWKQVFTIIPLLLLELTLVSNNIDTVKYPDSDLSLLRAPNLSNRMVYDYTGQYSIDGSNLRIDSRIINLTYMPRVDAILSKVGSNIYYDTQQGLATYNISTGEQSIDQNFVTELSLYTPKGSLYQENNIIYNYYGEPIITNVIDTQICYNTLIVYGEGMLYLVDLNSCHIKRVVGKDLHISKSAENDYIVYNGDICVAIIPK